MSYAVVIPILAKDIAAAKGYFQTVSYFLSKGVPVAVVVNGCTVEEAETLQRFYDTAPKHFSLLWGGEEPSPYPSRNVGLSYFFGGGRGVDAVALIDSDTEAADDYHDKALLAIRPDKLIAGRINTRVPRGISWHLDNLADIGFECFDGYGPPDSTIGANMIIGRFVYNDVGKMKDDVMSGGDADYSVRAKRQGYNVTQHNELLVSKVIFKYSYRVIVEKQIRRSLCVNPALSPLVDQTIAGLRCALHNHLHALEGAATLEDLKPRYGELIDSLFALMWFEGLIANHIDRTK